MGFTERVLIQEAVRLSSATYTPIPYFFDTTWNQYRAIIKEVIAMSEELKNGRRK
ncbi:MAG: hypothetical protein LBP19_05325 [Treponema sp.]|nr:hypothetical protein [Treponema sp.]